MSKKIVAEAKRTAQISLWGNLTLAILKGVTGVVGNSFALIADAIESSTDVVGSIFVLWGLNYSTKPADDDHPYGHGKAEALVTFAVVGFLLVSAFIIAHESIVNIQTPHVCPKSFTLYVLGAIVIIKELFYRFVDGKSKDTQSSSLKADAWHHRSDAITSLMAFIGISVALYMGPGYESADDWAALFASGFIVYNAYLILRPALGEIMDEHRYDQFIEELRTTSKGVEGVIYTEKCYVRKMGMRYVVDLHLVVDAELTVREGHRISHLLKDTLMASHPEIADVLIHVEPNDYQ
jgi:cation diffusion facilitator family transporter